MFARYYNIQCMQQKSNYKSVYFCIFFNKGYILMETRFTTD